MAVMVYALGMCSHSMPARLPASLDISEHALARPDHTHLSPTCQAGAVQSPSWKRLSPASVPESIRELATKYSSDPDRRLGRTPPDASASPLPAAEAMELEAATPVPAGGAGAEGSSPALEPTPHAVLDSVMKVNALYNTSPAEPPAAVAAAPLSPSSAVAQLLAPVLLATINEIDGGKEKTQQQTQQGE